MRVIIASHHCRAVSFRLGTGELDHFGPFLGFFGDELTEVGGRTGLHYAAEISEPCPRLGVSQRSVDLPVEPVDNLGGWVPGRTYAEQRACLVARHEFGE